jgi:hypothetical protein
MNYEWQLIAEDTYALDIEVGLIIRTDGNISSTTVYVPDVHLVTAKNGTWVVAAGTRATATTHYPELKYGCAVLCGND